MSLYILGGVTGGLGKQLVQLVPGAIPVSHADCELCSQWSVQNWTESIKGQPVHIINLAGLSHSAMIHKGSYDDWLNMLRINVAGNALLLKNLRPLFKSRPGSTFTMVGSVTTKLGVAGTGVYTASKAALEGLCKVAAKEFAPFGRVNLLELGYFNTGIIDQVPVHPKIPLARLGHALDLAHAWTFVINCGYLTSAVIPINGGLI